MVRLSNRRQGTNYVAKFSSDSSQATTVIHERAMQLRNMLHCVVLKVQDSEGVLV